MKKPVTLIFTTENDEPYFISDEKIGTDELCIFSINGKLIEAYPDDMLGPEIEWVKKIAATPEQIGLIYTDENYTKNSLCSYYKVANYSNLREILKGKLKCELEVRENGDLELLDKKVIIHLSKSE